MDNDAYSKAQAALVVMASYNHALLAYSAHFRMVVANLKVALRSNDRDGFVTLWTTFITGNKSLVGDFQEMPATRHHDHKPSVKPYHHNPEPIQPGTFWLRGKWWHYSTFTACDFPDEYLPGDDLGSAEWAIVHEAGKRWGAAQAAPTTAAEGRKVGADVQREIAAIQQAEPERNHLFGWIALATFVGAIFFPPLFIATLILLCLWFIQKPGKRPTKASK